MRQQRLGDLELDLSGGGKGVELGLGELRRRLGLPRPGGRRRAGRRPRAAPSHQKARPARGLLGVVHADAHRAAALAESFTRRRVLRPLLRPLRRPLRRQPLLRAAMGLSRLVGQPERAAAPGATWCRNTHNSVQGSTSTSAHRLVGKKRMLQQSQSVPIKPEPVDTNTQLLNYFLNKPSPSTDLSMLQNLMKDASYQASSPKVKSEVKQESGGESAGAMFRCTYNVWMFIMSVSSFQVLLQKLRQKRLRQNLK